MDAGTLGSFLPAVWLLAVGVAGYAGWLGVSQRSGISLGTPRRRGTWVVAAMLVLAGAANFWWRDHTWSGLAVAAVLAAFGLFWAVQRNGVGRGGLYVGGVRYPWGRVADVSITGGGHRAVVHFSAGKAEKDLALPGTSREEVQQLVDKMQRAYGATPADEH